MKSKKIRKEKRDRNKRRGQNIYERTERKEKEREAHKDMKIKGMDRKT